MDSTPLTHDEVHAAWSASQLRLFEEMSPKDRILAIKTDALEHWSETDRDAAIDIVGGVLQRQPPVGARNSIFEEAKFPLAPVATHAGPLADIAFAAVGGWIFFMAALTAHSYGVF